MATATNETFLPVGTSGQLTIGGANVVSGAVVSSLVRTDWQGAITLSTSSRTNYLIGSTDVSTGWSKLGSTTSSSTDAPTGSGTTAVRVAGMAASSDYYYRSTGTIPAGSRFPVFWMRQVTTTGTIWVTDPAGTAYGKWAIDLSLLSGSWQRITSSHAAVTVVNALTAASDQGSGLAFQYISGPTPLSFDMACPMVTMSNGVNIPTTTDPVAITDYSYTDAGAVTLGQTASGTYVWSGSGDTASQSPAQQDGGGGGVHKKQGVTAGAGLRVPYRHEKPVDEFGYEINEPSVPPTPLPKVSAPREAPIPTGPTALDLAIAPPYREPVVIAKTLPTLQIKSGPTPDEVMKAKHNHALRLLLLAS